MPSFFATWSKTNVPLTFVSIAGEGSSTLRSAWGLRSEMNYGIAICIADSAAAGSQMSPRKKR